MGTIVNREGGWKSPVRFMQRALSDQHGDGPLKVAIDLANIQWFGETGLGYLLKIFHEADKTGGETVVANARPRVKDIFSITMLYKVFRICDSLEEAFRVLWAENGGMEAEDQ